MEPPLFAAIGGGNMARAIITGSLRAHHTKPHDWLVAEPNDDTRNAIEQLGVTATRSASDFASRLSPRTQIILAVKPQSLDAAARDAARLDLRDRIVLSILAGATSARIRTAMGGSCRVIRVMPNTPAQIGAGCTAVAIGAGASPGDEASALALFRAVGPVVEFVDESLMDAFTALAGSGPAYVFYLAQAMIDAAARTGFAPDQADRIVRQVITGSAALLAASPAEPPHALRAAVTSKGGTTEAAARVLDERRVHDALVDAIIAARDRGRELSSITPAPAPIP